MLFCMAEINKNTIIADILKIKPKAAEVLLSHGMHCLGCSIASGETLEQAAGVHGIDINKLMEEINKI
jgi:hybrid cluster-associated redox disulfide protein